jgi:hypothetical protein
MVVGVYLDQQSALSLCVQFTIFVWRCRALPSSELAELHLVMMQSK